MITLILTLLAMGLFGRRRDPDGYGSADTLEDAVDYCADCGIEIPAGDYLCDDCE